MSERSVSSIVSATVTKWRFDYMWNPRGPRLCLVLWKPRTTKAFMLSVGGWYLGRDKWPCRAYFKVERFR